MATQSKSHSRRSGRTRRPRPHRIAKIVGETWVVALLAHIVAILWNRLAIVVKTVGRHWLLELSSHTSAVLLLILLQHLLRVSVCGGP